MSIASVVQSNRTVIVGVIAALSGVLIALGVIAPADAPCPAVIDEQIGVVIPVE